VTYQYPVFVVGFTCLRTCWNCCGVAGAVGIKGAGLPTLPGFGILTVFAMILLYVELVDYFRAWKWNQRL